MLGYQIKNGKKCKFEQLCCKSSIYGNRQQTHIAQYWFRRFRNGDDGLTKSIHFLIEFVPCGGWTKAKPQNTSPTLWSLFGGGNKGLITQSRVLLIQYTYLFFKVFSYRLELTLHDITLRIVAHWTVTLCFYFYILGYINSPNKKKKAKRQPSRVTAIDIFDRDGTQHRLQLYTSDILTSPLTSATLSTEDLHFIMEQKIELALPPGPDTMERNTTNARVWKQFRETIQFREDGYYVRLPWKDNCYEKTR
uniref:HTH_48 domain-containing protein n=1 Tax=Heterorhabditis bacteriophora TaxID=37862 RepID=A0A1I7WBI6_HETBA